jgi:secreted PhoX family phosphatase
MLSRRLLLATAAVLPWATVAHAQKRDDTTASGFSRDVVIRWGDLVEPDSPPFAPNFPTPEAAARQFGWDALVLGVLPQPLGADGVPRALLVVAHPTADARMMFPGGRDLPVAAVLGQGASILNLEQHAGRWAVADGGFQSRRLTGSTLCRVTGPQAQIVEAALGLLSVNAGCVTPWGSALMAEGDPNPWFARLGDRSDRLPRRRDAPAYGWLAELDPFDPEAMPAKRTALGRFPRAGVAATRSADGHAVVFMTDDRPQGHLFRFVASSPTTPDNPDTLDQGTLSVAVFDGDMLRFVALADARDPIQAAATLHAARFDYPAGMAFGGQGVLLLACRGTGLLGNVAPSRLADGNPDGRILVLTSHAGDPTAERFDIELGLIGGDTGTGAPAIVAPSGLAVAADGRVWIATDGSGIAVASGDFTTLAEVYRPPVGAVMGGVAQSPDGALVFAAVRHPGDTPTASFDNPATRWPTLRPDMPPQTTIIGLSARR